MKKALFLKSFYVNLLFVPKWRNWQTRGTQNPVPFTGSVGSTPTFGTKSHPSKLASASFFLHFSAPSVKCLSKHFTILSMSLNTPAEQNSPSLQEAAPSLKQLSPDNFIAQTRQEFRAKINAALEEISPLLIFRSTEKLDPLQVAAEQKDALVDEYNQLLNDFNKKATPQKTIDFLARVKSSHALRQKEIRKTRIRLANGARSGSRNLGVPTPRAAALS